MHLVKKTSLGDATASHIVFNVVQRRKENFSGWNVKNCIYLLTHKFAGGDALMGNTRTHPEHDG